MKTRDGLTPEALVGRTVMYRVDGVTVFWGQAEYLTRDGWFGIRQHGGRLDEAPVALCMADPT